MSARTQDKRLWLGGGALTAVLIVLLGWFFVIDPELSAASSTWNDAESVRMQNTVLEAKNTRLKAQNDDVAALRAGLADALAALPFDSGLPAFTRQVSKQAAETSVVLSSVVVAGAVPVAEAAAAAGATTADPEATIPTTGLVAISVTVVGIGSCSADMEFLKAIQVTGPRRALVTDVQLTPATGDAPCTLTVQLTVFSAPLSPTAHAALEKLLSGG